MRNSAETVDALRKDIARSWEAATHAMPSEAAKKTTKLKKGLFFFKKLAFNKITEREALSTKQPGELKMKVIRHNTATGNLAVYASKKDAGSEMPVFATAEEFTKTTASISALIKFHNQKVAKEKAVKAFRDKPTALARVWGVAMGAEPEKDVATQPTQEDAPEKPARAPRPGTSKMNGKTIFGLKEVNPRRAGTEGFKSYEIVRGKKEGVKYEDYIAAGGRGKDLKWDIDKGFARVD